MVQIIGNGKFLSEDAEKPLVLQNLGEAREIVQRFYRLESLLPLKHWAELRLNELNYLSYGCPFVEITWLIQSNI